MRHKIGILTFHASHNYGSMLQAYALQTYLQSMGNEVVILNLRSDKQKKMYESPSVFHNFGRKKLKNAVRHPLLYVQNLRKWSLFENFLHTYLNVTKEYSTYKEVESDLSKLKCDILISGGDQIWNQKCKDFELSYFLPFAQAGVKKVSYCPSLGRQTQAMMQVPFVNNYLQYVQAYDFISVREPDAAAALTEILKKEVKVVADPAMMLDTACYDQIMDEEPLVKGKYMFYYTPSHMKAPKAYAAALKFAQEKGLTLVSSNAFSHHKGVKKVNACGPLEFLNLLKHADFVCGQSFHLVVFSLLYHKEFSVLNGDKDPRMVNLLGKCGIPKRGVNIENPDFSMMESLDFGKIDQCIANMRKESEAFFHSFLSK